jgi:elongation factor Ts
MSKVTMDLVKELREKTQVSLMECKKALEAADGNIEQALEFLRKKGASIAAKRSDSTTNNGRIEAFISPDSKLGAIIEVGCETDFSANTDAMHNFVVDVAQVVAKNNPKTTEELLDLVSSRESKYKIKDAIDELVAKIGERTLINKFVSFNVATNGLVNAYIHPGSTVGVMIELETDKAISNVEKVKELAKDVCMQIAVMRPLCVEPSQLDKSLVDKEREIAREQLKNSGKPAPIIEKIVDGKINKYYEDVCLENEFFIKNDKLTVKQHVDEVAKQLGLKIKIKQFVRYSVKR